MESQRMYPIAYVTYTIEIHPHCCIHHSSSLFYSWVVVLIIPTSGWLRVGICWLSFPLSIGHIFLVFFCKFKCTIGILNIMLWEFGSVKTLWRMLTDVSNQSTFKRKVLSCNQLTVVALSVQFSKLCYAVLCLNCTCPSHGPIWELCTVLYYS